MKSSVSIDVDGVRHYHAIHGLPPPTGIDPVWTTGLPRVLELCADRGVRATLFVVTADLADDAARALLRQAHAAGHEIASHSHAHRYDLSELSPAEIEADLRRSIDAIIDVTGAPPRGFRAPGYTLSAPLVDALVELGFAYDSSVMRAPAYWAARAAARLALRVRGRPSAALRGELRQFLPGFVPRGLRELAIGTALGWPWLGTSLALLPAPLGAISTTLARATARRDPLVLELHAIDLCGPGDGFSSALLSAQPDLRRAPATKRARIGAAVAALAPGARPLAEWV